MTSAKGRIIQGSAFGNGLGRVCAAILAMMVLAAVANGIAHLFGGSL